MKKILSVVMLSLLTAPASAALINNGNKTFTDTATGYQWATLSQFNNQSFAASVAELAPGFHVASAAELATLTVSAPAAPASFAADFAAMGAQSNRGLIWGYFGDGTQWAWKFNSDTNWHTNNSSAYGWINNGYTVSPLTASSDLALFAVNTSASAVPEPTTLALFGLSLLGLTLVRRSRR